MQSTYTYKLPSLVLNTICIALVLYFLCLLPAINFFIYNYPPSFTRVEITKKMYGFTRVDQEKFQKSDRTRFTESTAGLICK